MKKLPLKQFIVRKYVMATSAGHAIRKERSTPVADVWVDDDWKKKQDAPKADVIGFSKIAEEEEE